MSHTTTDFQRRLVSLGYLDAGGVDGIFGQHSLDAYNHYRASLGKPPVKTPHMAELNADLFPGDVPAAKAAKAPAKPAKPSILDQIGAVVSIINLLKGKTMTTDQLTGTIRTILAALGGYLAAKGYFPQISPELLTAITTVLVTAWSWYSNRPKTIQTIADKVAGK